MTDVTEPRDGGVRTVAVQIDDYDLWTRSPAPRRETDLQALQARLFATVAVAEEVRDGFAFAGRFDNVVGVANGMAPGAFERLQERVRNRYPVTVSVGVGTASTPAASSAAAGEVLRDAGSAQRTDRREVLGHRTADGVSTGSVTVAHFDLVDATGEFTDRVSPARAVRTIRNVALAVDERLREGRDAVTHFVGGDNVTAVCPRVGRSELDAVREEVRERTGVDLQVGVGHGTTDHAAGDDAKHALEECRETGERIRGPWGAAAD